MSPAGEATSEVSASPLPWTRALGVQVTYYCWVKIAGSLAFSACFFAGYFSLLKHPAFPVTIMPTVGLDRWILFQPQAIWVYGSLFVYLQLAPALLRTKREMWSYSVALSAMTLVAFAFFFFRPTIVPSFDIDWASYPGFAALKKADAAGNACPSLHVAFAVFTLMWCSVILRDARAPIVLRVGNWLWALGIVYSTLATRQHVALDVAAGAALGALSARIHLQWLKDGFAPAGRWK